MMLLHFGCRSELLLLPSNFICICGVKHTPCDAYNAIVACVKIISSLPVNVLTHRDIHCEGKNQSQYKCTLQLSLLRVIVYRILFYDIYINHALISLLLRNFILIQQL